MVEIPKNPQEIQQRIEAIDQELTGFEGSEESNPQRDALEAEKNELKQKERILREAAGREVEIQNAGKNIENTSNTPAEQEPKSPAEPVKDGETPDAENVEESDNKFGKIFDSFMSKFTYYSNKIAEMVGPFINTMMEKFKQIPLLGNNETIQSILSAFSIIGTDRIAFFDSMKDKGLELVYTEQDPDIIPELKKVFETVKSQSRNPNYTMDSYFVFLAGAMKQKLGTWKTVGVKDLIAFANETKTVEMAMNNANLTATAVAAQKPTEQPKPTEIELPKVTAGFDQLRTGGIEVAGVGSLTLVSPDRLKLGDKTWKLVGKEGMAKGRDLTITDAGWNNGEFTITLNNFSTNKIPATETLALMKKLAEPDRKEVRVEVGGEYSGVDLVVA